MSRFWHRTVALVVFGLTAPPLLAESPESFTAEQIQFFEQQVRPILAARCLNCHGETKQESGLRLDSRAAVLRGGDSDQPAAEPGDPDHSQLVAAINRRGDYEMPPDERLPDREIQTITDWVKMGLPWPSASEPAPMVLSMDERLREQRATHWSLQPIRRPPLPDVQNSEWVAQPIDAFVLARLEAAGLTPSSPVDRRTLIRRATFDLLGLPPTPDEVEAFVNDQSAGAYERLVDRLLASPRYGERWGRHWLDVARYADTRGYSFGKERKFPYAYTYRDYVIDAFNDDKPFDQFVIEQVAADRLPANDDPRALAALGFLTVGRKFNNGQDDIDDQIDVVCRGLMGLTVACARCHDHKFDAIPTEDYYSLYGVFASSREPDDRPLIGNPAESVGYEAFQQELNKRKQVVDDYTAAKHAELLDASRRRVSEYLVRAADKPEALLEKRPFVSLGPDELKPGLIERWRGYLREHAKPGDPIFGAWRKFFDLPSDDFSGAAAMYVAAYQDASPNELNPLIKTALLAEPPKSKADVARIYGQVLQDAYAAWQAAGANAGAMEKLSAAQQSLVHVLLDENTPTNIPIGEMRGYLVRADREKQRELEREVDTFQINSPAAPPRAMVLVDNNSPFNPRVFLRGNQGRPGKPVPRQFPVVLAGENRKPFAVGSGRLELAQAIVADDNPLTARVIVNRVWMHHFGQPLVDTPSDFGMRASPPTHPELLDYLAWTLRENEWSLKDLHRAILRSSTYQQASVDRPECRTADPENRLLWRMNRVRIEFEPLRDALLAVADRLDETAGGRPVDLMSAPFTQRRAVYGLIDRQDLPNLFRAFDFASPDQSSPRRSQTSVPQQALFMMNSPFVVEQAKALIARDDVAAQTDFAARIVALYRILFAREPADDEVQIGRRFVGIAEQTASPDAKLSPWEQYAQLLLFTNEFMFID